MDSHLKGKLCPECRDILIQELGNYLFYMAALCNLLDLNLYDIMILEMKNSPHWEFIICHDKADQLIGFYHGVPTIPVMLFYSSAVSTASLIFLRHVYLFLMM